MRKILYGKDDKGRDTIIIEIEDNKKEVEEETEKEKNE